MMLDQGRKDKIKNAIGKVMQESVDNFREGKNLVAWTTLESDICGGRIMLVIWPKQNTISVTFSAHENGFGDLGTEIASVSMEYFGLEEMIWMISALIDYSSINE